MLAVRLTSQFGDGLFQAGLAWLILLSPQQQRTPAAVAAAAAVILLPFSFVGPFAGAFLDRWSRRQVLVYAQGIRVAALGLLWVVAASEHADVAAYSLAIGCLGANRFLLTALSAGLPHVVPRDLLVMANAVAPTAGTVATLIGVGAGGLVLAVDGAGSRTVLALAAGAFTVAGLLALRLDRSGLGPDLGVAPAALGVRRVAADVASGLLHLRSRPRAAESLLTFGAYRFWYGLWTVQAAMLTLSDQEGSLSAAATVAAASGAGFLVAAGVTPFGMRRFRLHRWTAGLLGLAAVAAGTTAVARSVPALALTGFALGLVAQSVKIGTDTALQRHLDDDNRGRAFAVYDVTFNATFVAAAGFAVLLVPESGDTWLVPLLCAAGIGGAGLSRSQHARAPAEGAG